MIFLKEKEMQWFGANITHKFIKGFQNDNFSSE
jgi:hypothetical protein